MAFLKAGQEGQKGILGGALLEQGKDLPLLLVLGEDRGYVQRLSLCHSNCNLRVGHSWEGRGRARTRREQVDFFFEFIH